jgi:sugar lactone lactonase YvrE
MLASLLMSGALLAAPFPQTIPVPPGSQPEGIAAGQGRTAYVGSRADGSVYRLNVRSGKGRVLVRGREGRGAYGLKRAGRRLYVAGGPTGFVYVYDARTGRPVDAVDVDGAFVNDVTVTREAAYFTDSQKAVLYAYPRGGGEPAIVNLTGDWEQQEGFNANGIAATPDGETLIVVQSGTGKLFTVVAESGLASEIDLGPDVVTNGDGLLLEGRRLYVVRNQDHEIAVVRLNRDLTSGRIARTLKDEDFDTPTTAARVAGRLYAVNARFSVEEPDEETTYDVVRVG